MIEHLQLAMLRRLLVNSKRRTKPIPSKVKAVLALAYARELHLRKARQARRALIRDNPLGII
jgi:hypothetical protein